MEIQGYPNYLIYPDGRIWSNYRKRGACIFLKNAVHRKGYHQVALWRDKKRKMCKVHRLVAQTFIPNPDNKPEVDHINRIRHDNRVENLRWATVKEQCENKGKQSNNKSGHTNISYAKDKKKRWSFAKVINKKSYQKRFETKIEALCYKFCFMLLSQQGKRLACTVENGQNKGKNITNKSGHKNICYEKAVDKWKFQKIINKKIYRKLFETKIEGLVYKFCFLLINQQRKRLACDVRR